MDKIASGTDIISKNGGPKMKMRWYLDSDHIEASWYQDGVLKNNTFHIADVEIWDDIIGLDIEVIEPVIENSKDHKKI